MRKLIVTRGLPGSGKSHTLEKLGLIDFTLAADTLRLQIASPVLMPDGRMAITPEHDRRVWSQLFEILDQRMSRGETVCVDATHPTAAEFKKYLELARLYRYEVACLDFSEVPPQVSDWHNDGRADYRQVPQHAIDRIAARTAAGQVPQSVRRIMVRSIGTHLAEVRNWLDVPLLDLSDYSQVVHVGDIQGCYTALNALLGDRLRADAFYIFVGDACDRGEENGEVMRWLLDHACGRENVRFLWGNHEDHLHREALGLPPVSAEFAEVTLPQLKSAGVTRAELDSFCNGLDDILFYRHGRHRVMVTHAGLSTVPSQAWMVPSRQFARGTGWYEDDVDAQFERHAPEGWYQVHGHRNHRHRDTRATGRSFNLEASVEHGGHLRAVSLSAEGFRPMATANPVFRPFRSRRHHRMTIVPPWMLRDEQDATVMAADLREAMAAHPEVRAKSSVSYPHVESLNFSRRVFYSQLWDDVVCKARGLFVDRDTGEIVSRGYDKFFNVGERAETSLEALQERLTFPLTLWVKENGFLGNTGYDRRTDSLFVASKSTPDGDFASWFREILEDTLPLEGQREALKRFLRDTESSMVMEVIDPIRDPHMIEYEQPKLVVLDVIRRSSRFEKLPYDELMAVGKRFGIEVKQKGITLKDWRSFEGWYRRASQDMTKQIEGYVIEDAAGYQVKVKLPFYAFWKWMRGTKDAMLRERTGGKPARLDHLASVAAQRGLPEECGPLAERFVAWCRDLDAEALSQDIITLRRAFAEVKPEERIGMSI